MKCLQRLEAAASEAGGSVDYTGLPAGFVNVDAPLGKVWEANRCPGITVSGADDTGSDWTGAVKRAIEDMRQGYDDPCDEWERSDVSDRLEDRGHARIDE